MLPDAIPRQSHPSSASRRPRMRKPRSLRFRSASTLGALLLASAISPLVYANTVTWTGSAGTNDWSSVVLGVSNWSSSPALPGAADDVQNNTNTSIIHSTGSDTINSFLSTGAFTLQTSALNANTATSTFQVNNTFTLNAGTLNGFIVNPGSGGQGITVTNSGGNRINGSTLNAILDLTGASAFVQVDSGGLTINNNVNIDNSGRLRSNANQTFDGTGSIVFGSAGGTLDSAAGTLTLGNNLTVHGQNGTIDAQLINNGLISADVATGTISDIFTTTNNGTLQAKNGGTLALTSMTLTNTAGLLDAQAGSTILVNASTINGGTEQGAGLLKFTNNGGNRINGATINGTMDLTAASAFAEVDGSGLTLNGTVNIDNAGRLRSNANQTFGGNGNIVFGAAGGTLDSAAGTLTIGNNLTVHGVNGTLDAQLVNNGLISSDGGGTISDIFTTTNNGTMRAVSGSTLALTSMTLTNNGILDTANGGLIAANAATINGGTVTGAGTLRFTNNGGNRLNGVTLTNTLLDLTSASAFVQVDGGGLTINDTVQINNSGRLISNANQTFSGSGEILFGSTGGTLQTVAGTLTLDPGITVHGENGTINVNLINNGLISADVSGGNINILSSSLTNNATLQAKNGGTLTLTSTTLNNSVGALLDAQTGSTILVNASTINGGTEQGAGLLKFTNNGGNRINGTTINGTMDLTSSSAFAQVDGSGLTLNGTVNIDNAGRLISNANQTFGGNGNIVFGSAGGTLDSAAGTLTIGNNLTVHGVNGTLDAQLVNNGLISSDGGGTINDIFTTTNNGTMRAVSGSTLALTSMTLTNNGILDTANGGLISVNAATINGGTEQGAGLLKFSGNGGNRINGATINGTMDLTAASAFAQVDGGGLTLNGTVNIDNSGRLISNANQTFGGNGNIVFGAAGGTLGTAAGTLTIGNNLTVRGQNGTINANFINDGKISADVAAGTISVTTGFTSNGTIEAKNGGNLSIAGAVTSTGNVNVGTGSQISLTGLTQSGASTNVDGTLKLNNGTGTLALNGGTLGGNGTVNGNVTVGSAATVSPGHSPGDLTITGNYAQAGALLVELGGTTPGTGFDQLNVSGAATLDSGSALDVSLVNGFNPFVGETFNIFNYNSLAGAFSTLASLDPGFSYTFADDGSGKHGELTVTQVAVVANVTPEPGAWALLCGLATSLAALRYRRRRGR